MLALGALLAFGMASMPAGAQSATVKFPRLDQRIEHPDPELDATYGWVFELADVDEPGPSSVADFLIGSIAKNIGQAADAGVAYVHHGPTLPAPDAFNTLAPSVAQAANEFGRLKVTVGDVRGFASDPTDVPHLVFVPAFQRTLDLSPCGESTVAPVGSIEIFDMTDADGNNDPYVATIVPPGNPDLGETVPCGVRSFGHWSDTGDVNGDGIDDLVVGAPTSDGGMGRVYIFFGFEDFHLDPAPSIARPGWLKQWAILYPPPDPPAPAEPFPTNAAFGFSLSVADLDGDGFAEIGVGRVEKARGPGRVHVFHGDWVQDNVGHHTFSEIVPSAPVDIESGVEGEYETLVDDDVVRPSVVSVGFGWVVSLKGGDLGTLGEQAFDTLPDVLVHSEGAGGLAADGVTPVDAGALFVYLNDSDTPGTDSLVDETQPLKLMTPRINVPGGLVYAPAPTRYGRSFDVAAWERLDGSPCRILLVGEPDRQFPDPQDPEELIEGAGAVYAYLLPLPPVFDPHSTSNGHLNAWGDDVLLEPADLLGENMFAELDVPGGMAPQTNARWGGWIEVGVYDPFLPSDQFGICARERTVGAFRRVGRVYTFSLPPAEP